MQSDSIKELVTALVSAQGEFSAIPKTSDNPFFKSKYAALPDVVLQATPILTKNGLSVMQFVGYDDANNDTLTTYLAHTSGEYIVHTMKLHLPKNDPQGQGSAITYARRYAYMSALGLVADNDDDGNYASLPKSAPQQSSAVAPKSANNSLSGKVASATGGKMATDGMTKMIWAITHKSLNWDDATMYDTIDTLVGRKVDKLTDLTFDEAKLVIDHLKSLQEQ